VGRPWSSARRRCVSGGTHGDARAAPTSPLGRRAGNACEVVSPGIPGKLAGRPTRVNVGPRAGTEPKPWSTNRGRVRTVLMRDRCRSGCRTCRCFRSPEKKPPSSRWGSRCPFPRSKTVPAARWCWQEATAAPEHQSSVIPAPGHRGGVAPWRPDPQSGASHFRPPRRAFNPRGDAEPGSAPNRKRSQSAPGGGTLGSARSPASTMDAAEPGEPAGADAWPSPPNIRDLIDPTCTRNRQATTSILVKAPTRHAG
jgi:hypothetical protein